MRLLNCIIFVPTTTHIRHTIIYYFHHMNEMHTLLSLNLCNAAIRLLSFIFLYQLQCICAIQLFIIWTVWMRCIRYSVSINATHPWGFYVSFFFTNYNAYTRYNFLLFALYEWDAYVTQSQLMQRSNAASKLHLSCDAYTWHNYFFISPYEWDAYVEKSRVRLKEPRKWV